MTRRILVVDDSRTQLERLRLLLHGAGYEVETATDGQEGLELAEGSPPDLIISDVVMPRMDGFEFCRGVRRNPTTRRTPFILVTERAGPEDIVKGLEAGADNFIPKPYDEDELLRRVERIIEQLTLRGRDYLGVEVRLQVGNRDLTVTADKQQIMELLFSAMEALGRRTDDLMRTNRELQEAVTEAKSREAALAESEARYRRARDQAEQANRAKDRFLSRMSHELRTPLNAILGFSQLLEMTDLPADNRESVAHITKAGHHLLELINEVLDISRIATGNISLAAEPVSLALAVDDAAELVRSLAAQRNIEIRVDDAGSPGDAHVLADHQRLKQVLLNLFSNAIKYNREGGRVMVSWGRCGEELLHITVADTGIGIPQDRMDRLFSEFDRLGAEQTDVEGTGLGLSLTRGLIQAMGGSIAVQSEAGAGSVFTVELPAAEAPARHNRHSPVGSLAEPAPTTGRHTVLCIEDNASNLKLVERIFLERPEVTLLSATKGRMGLELARQRRPDLVLLDVHLPDLPGDEVLRCLREDPATRRIPVLVLSGDATQSQIDRLLAAGASDYITKPFDMRRFLGAVDELLEDPAGPPPA